MTKWSFLLVLVILVVCSAQRRRCTEEQKAQCPEYRMWEYMAVTGCTPVYRGRRCCASHFNCPGKIVLMLTYLPISATNIQFNFIYTTIFFIICGSK